MSQPNSPPLRIEVGIEDANRRLDQLVVARLGDRGRRRVSTLFEDGRVWCGGRPAKKGDRARPGDLIVVDAAESPDVVPEQDAPLDVRLETPQVLVVEKPPGIPTGPLLRGETGTLCNALLGHFPELGGVGYGPLEPGILHRLDNETSGLVVVARSQATWGHLRSALSNERIEKRYLAVVSGRMTAPSGVITTRLGPHPDDPRRVTTVPPGKRGQPRGTAWSILEERGALALLDVRVTRAYRHQIRAHLASVGMPLVGDALYGGTPSPRLAGGRHALHASYVAWAGDEVVPGFRVESPAPADLGALLAD